MPIIAPSLLAAGYNYGLLAICLIKSEQTGFTLDIMDGRFDCLILATSMLVEFRRTNQAMHCAFNDRRAGQIYPGF
jgi:pentose-5-phosphate-3-epimerase